MGFRACLVCVFSTFVTWVMCTESKQKDSLTAERIDNTNAVVGRLFVYSLRQGSENEGPFEVFQKKQESLPQWLSFDAEKSSLVGVPSWRDRGQYDLDIRSRGNVQRSLKINVKDLRDGDLQVLSNSNNSKLVSYPEPNCPKGMPVAAASIVLDYHLGKLTGKERADILRKLSNFVDVDAGKLHMLAGKGHNTAFGFKDVITVTAGPGNVADSKQPGVAVSWQVGCSVDIPSARMASFLKSSAVTGAFQQSLGLPVCEWHIAVGQPKEPRQRARRQTVQGEMVKYSNHAARRNARAIQPTATPTLTVAPPTSVVPRATITITKTSSVAPTSTVTPTTTPMVPTTSERPSTTEAVAAEAPTTSKPSTTAEAPTTTEASTTSEKPTTTEASTTTEKPTTFKHQKTTEKPTTTESSTTTEKPTTKPSTSTEKRTTTPKPTTTDKPATTEWSTTTEQPSTTEEPTKTKRPSSSEEPTTTKQPSTTKAADSTTTEVSISALEEEKTKPITSEKADTSVASTSFEPITEKADTSVASTSFEPITEKPEDGIPKLINPIGQLKVYRGQVLVFHIPEDTFYDKEDKLTPNMTLEIRTIHWKRLTKSSWINLDAENQIIYALPMDKDNVNISEFIIIASDSENNQGLNVIEVNVLDDDSASHNHQVELVLDHDFEQFSADLNTRVSLLKKLAKYAHLEVNNIRVDDITKGSVVLKLHFDTIPEDDCDFPLKRAFFDDEGNVNSNLSKALEPDFEVKKGSFEGLGPCKVSVTSTSFEPITKKPEYEFPTLINPIGQLKVYRGQVLVFHIPEDTFYGKEDTLTPNMTLDIRTINWKPLAKSSWINLDAENQIIYALPMDKDKVSISEFIIIATDSENNQGHNVIEVNVLDDDSASHNHQIELVLDHDFEQFSADLNTRVSLLKKLAKYAHLEVNNIRVDDITKGSVVLKLHFDTIPEDDCDFPLKRAFFDDEGNVNSNLSKALEPDFEVKKGSFEGLGPCKGGVIVARSEGPSGKWETYVIIPAVILVVVLLFIIGCLFLVMRSRRKRKMSLEDKNVFVFQKKPSVLQEEYEIKERLLKQPLVLPNEKPPLQPPTYPRSPSLKHANGDTTPLVAGYQAPSFTSSRSPSTPTSPGGNSPRKPTYSGYRLPPAYVPP